MTKLNIETFPIGPIQTNCYLVWPEKENVCWIIDPGGLGGAIIKIIEAEKLQPQMLIVTHGHWDHFLGNRGLKDKFPKLPIAIHQADADVLPDANANMSLSFIGKSILSPPADVLLHDGDELNLGSLHFKVIHTPGHSPGGICLYCSDAEEKVLFAGDLIFAGGGVGRTDLPKSSSRQLYESISKIFETLPEETIVYPGHGPSTTLGEEKKILGL
ncbi:MAG: MBL fold metallo-hydrolase [Phycisphaerae bacterium]